MTLILQLKHSIIGTYVQLKHEILLEQAHPNQMSVQRTILRYGTVNPYWHHVGLYYEQLEGLIAGYDAASETSNLTIPAGDLFWMNVQGDIEDLEQVRTREC